MSFVPSLVTLTGKIRVAFIEMITRCNCATKSLFPLSVVYKWTGFYGTVGPSIEPVSQQV